MESSNRITATVAANCCLRRGEPVRKAYIQKGAISLIKMLHSVALQGQSSVLSFHGGAPLRDYPRLLSAIPIGIEAEELSSEIDTQKVMSTTNS